MRKLSALILVLIMFTLPAFGESYDLPSMSLDELQTLYEKIRLEITMRTGEDAPKGYSGVFVGGKNMEVGPYNLNCLDRVTICRWSAEEDYAKGKMECEYSTHNKNDTVAVYINEGAVIEIYGGTVDIQPATEDWVPDK